MRQYVIKIGFTGASDTAADDFLSQFTDRILNTGEIASDEVGNVEVVIVPDEILTDSDYESDEAFCDREADYVPNANPIPEEIAHLDN